MNIVSAIVVFVCIWWIVFFCMLPVGLKRQDHSTSNEFAPGAPENPNIKKKMIWTSGLSIVLWGIAYYIINSNIIDLREMSEHI